MNALLALPTGQVALGPVGFPTSTSQSAATAGNCRFCNSPLHVTFVDLGPSPLCQDHVRPDNFDQAEAFYDLHAYVCSSCLLVQVKDLISPADVFPSDYAYFSSYSKSWLRHAQRYTNLMTERFGLGHEHLVVEVASNDGYLLQYFVEKGIQVLGIEPAENAADCARQKGINTLSKFFGLDTAREVAANLGQADLLVGNNVLAHVPDINDFVAGLAAMLKPAGVLTMEFPHLLQLVLGNQFDTIYHEHFSYLSFWVVERIFAHHGLTLFDVEELSTHGGSLRIYARHAVCSNSALAVRAAVPALRVREIEAGICDYSFYANFAASAKETKRKLLEFLIDAKRAGKTVVGYGAPGKGNTLLNYCGAGRDFIDYTVTELAPWLHAILEDA